MTVTQQRIAAALGAVAGIALLHWTDAPALGGAILGAAIASGLYTTVLDRHAAELHAAGDELAASQAQYEAAHATLGSQRERMRIQFEGDLAERTAVLNAAHQVEIFDVQRACYEAGAVDALSGRLSEYQEPASAGVIRLASRRRPHASNS